MGFRKILIGVLTVIALLGVWAFGIEPSWTRYRDYDVHVANWPKGASGFTIAFLSDTHVGGFHVSRDKMKRIVAEVNARAPDLILLGGDYVTSAMIASEHVPGPEIAAILGELRARHGVYGVLGNHDRWDNGRVIAAAFSRNGIPMLENSAVTIKLNDGEFSLVGLSDFLTGRRRIGSAFSNVDFRQPVIAFTHSPDIFPYLPQDGGLALAGHTHGGQVWLPFLGRLIVPSIHGERYALGQMREARWQYFITPGIGTSILPVRFMTPPEVSFLHIYP